MLIRRKIKSIINSDVFDFDMKINDKLEFKKIFFYRHKIKKDNLIFLQATRITPRKAIENSILFTYFYQKIKKIFYTSYKHYFDIFITKLYKLINQLMLNQNYTKVNNITIQDILPDNSIILTITFKIDNCL